LTGPAKWQKLPGMDGATRLAAYLVARKLTREKFARSIGVTDSAVSRWATGQREPSASTAGVIERKTKGKVPASSWAPKGGRRGTRAN
jgi:DNA-binding transcriptional regulator YdaS (Cro superfamily)